MRTIWFKQRYVAAIVAGEKTDTVRRIGSRRPPGVGELVGLSVGAREPFAAAVVTSIEDVEAGELDPERRAAVEQLCGQAARYRRIAFRVLRPPVKRLVNGGDSDRSLCRPLRPSGRSS